MKMNEGVLTGTVGQVWRRALREWLSSCRHRILRRLVQG
jgi:hypothetical protein